MRRIIFSFALILTLMASSAWGQQSRFKTLNFLNSIRGNQIVSGQHNDQKNLDCGASGPTGARYWTDQVYNITGKYPALYGGDFLFHGSSQLRWDMTYEAERQWNAGAMVNIMWHACPPTQGASCNWDGGLLSSITAQQFSELLTNGTNLNNTWKARVNEIAVHLQYLKEKGVEVLWRPYHEQNQTAFWWNSQGVNNTKALWRMMHNYMTNDLGLDNLIWVLDVQDIGGRTNYWDYNPGNQYWDIMALDVYADGLSNPEYYNNLVTAAGGKPIALGEVFNLPNAQQIDRFPQYTFFMNWAYGLKKWYAPDCRPTNSDAFIREVYNNPKVITRDEMPGWNTVAVPTNLATAKPVTVSSTEAGANVAANAVDGQYGTRWSSLYSDAQWLSVDLGATYNVNRVKITWEAAYGRDYTVQYSTNGTTWTTARSIVGNTALVNDHAGLTGTARYVRINGTARGTVYGYSIYELEVYGTLAVPPNLATAKPVTVSSTEAGANVAANAVDGQYGTRWSSLYSDAQWLSVDLGATYNVNRVKITWEAAYGRDYTVQYSTNGTSWTTARSISGNTVLVNDHTGLTGTARYVRINGTARGTVYGYSIYELEVYGTPATVTNQAPSVSLTTPANNATYTAPASITITASASDADGTISRVEFFSGSTKLGERTSTPYSYTWNNVAAGTYSITARATDNQGATTTSAARTVTVNPTTTNACSSIAEYTENGGYIAGSIVKNGNSRYQCRPWPYSGWCNGSAWAYAPGTGAYWSDAWALLGSCSARMGNENTTASTNELLLTNNPNPFSQSTTIVINLEEAGDISLSLYNKTGQLIELLSDGFLSSGTHQFVLNGSTMQADLYIVKCSTANGVITKKIIKTE